jgi:hypothetical protein
MIKRFSEWINESHQGDDESEEFDQEMDDLSRLVDLGLAAPGELANMRRTKYGSQYRTQFLDRLNSMFEQLGIEPADYTTERQRKNGTYYFQITAAQAERIIFNYPLPAGLTGAQGSRMSRMLREMEPARKKLRRMVQIDTRKIYNGTTVRSSRYQYFVYPGDIRTASWDKSPNSSGFVKFDGLMEPDAILARFIYQVALDTYHLAMGMLQPRG